MSGNGLNLHTHTPTTAIQSVTNLYVRVSHISFENQRFLKIQPLPEPRDFRDSVGG